MLRASNHVDDVERAAAAIARATALLITAGAGMGVDSGLPDFRGDEGFWKAYPPFRERGLSFMDLANPAWFEDDPGARLGLLRPPARALPHGRCLTGASTCSDASRSGRAAPSSSPRTSTASSSAPASPRTRSSSATARSTTCSAWAAAASPSFPPTPRWRWTPQASAPARRSLAARSAGRSPGPTSSCSETEAGTSRAAVSRSDVSSSSWTRPPRGTCVIECGAGKAIPTVRSTSERAAARLERDARADQRARGRDAVRARRPGDGSARRAHAHRSSSRLLTDPSVLVRKPEQSSDGDVLVDLGPPHPEPGPDQLPVATLFRGGVTQPREPFQGRAHGTAILEVEDHGVRDEVHAPRACVGRTNDRSTHATFRRRRLGAQTPAPNAS